MRSHESFDLTNELLEEMGAVSCGRFEGGSDSSPQQAIGW
jgi:hypothetical protein